MKQKKQPWMLVGPWYRWALPGVAAAGRQSAPALEKFASPDFVNAFLEEPQRSLKYNEKDRVHKIQSAGGFFGKKLVRLERRKLFLDTHSRFYLVVCELHCDAPGFPRVGREQVSRAGFVMRRLHVSGPPKAFAEVKAASDGLAIAQAKLAQFGKAAGKAAPPKIASGQGATAVFGKIAAREAGQQQAVLEAEVQKAQDHVIEVAAKHGVTSVLQGWVEGEHEGIGSWDAVEETPEAIDEATFPLYPLVPDPALPHHSAQGRTIYFGVVPATTADLDEQGSPRLDDQAVYHLRCFVRRKAPPGCPQEVVWSPRTEVFQLAPAMDLDGTSNRPATVQMPDLGALEAQANALGMGESGGLRMVTPEDSALGFAVDGDGEPVNASVGGASICFFAIPLITIVAFFVFRLFLPVVILLFGLWFMLRLKFCIPPSLSIDADLALTLDADFQAALELGVDVEIGASLKAQIAAEGSVTIGGVLFTSDADVDAKLPGLLEAQIDDGYPHNQDFADGLKAELGGDLNALGKMVGDLSTDFSEEPAGDGIARPLPKVGADLEYHPVIPPASV